jgi:nitroreductase
MSQQPLTPDEVLTTTRAVRRKLDLSRPVPREVIEECLEIAQQAPTGSNRQGWRFVVVTDPEKRRILGDCYKRGWQIYRGSGQGAGNEPVGDPGRAAVMRRIGASSAYLADHMGDVPVLVVPCIQGRTENAPIVGQAAQWGSILPATWSFMLAARARGLGTAWTTLHLYFEREAADALGIPFDQYMQAALVPVAYVLDDPFHPGPREPLDTMVSWNGWT